MKERLFQTLIVLSLLFTRDIFSSFIATRADLMPYHGKDRVVMIASPGRSGSWTLTQALISSGDKYEVIKTHLLPPGQDYKGKIIFIFSNPDQAAESALHKILTEEEFRQFHFQHVETADKDWLDEVGGGLGQTKENNLLAYDALGTFEQLDTWLLSRTTKASFNEATILAIKYENLWDSKTLKALRQFLRLPLFLLPEQQQRGTYPLTEQEHLFRQTHNKGTPSVPRYPAYNAARQIWKEAPPFQYLKMRSN